MSPRVAQFAADLRHTSGLVLPFTTGPHGKAGGKAKGKAGGKARGKAGGKAGGKEGGEVDGEVEGTTDGKGRGGSRHSAAATTDSIEGIYAGTPECLAFHSQHKSAGNTIVGVMRAHNTELLSSNAREMTKAGATPTLVRCDTVAWSYATDMHVSDVSKMLR